jgi:hypothetical protein
MDGLPIKVGGVPPNTQRLRNLLARAASPNNKMYWCAAAIGASLVVVGGIGIYYVIKKKQK